MIPTGDMYVYLCVYVLLTVYLVVCASREYLDSKTLNEKAYYNRNKHSRQWSKLLEQSKQWSKLLVLIIR